MAIYSVGRRRVIIALLLTSALLLTLDLRGNPLIDRARDGFSEVMDPIEAATGVVTTPIVRTWRAVNDIDDLERENAELRDQLDRMVGTQASAESSIIEAQELRALFNLPSLSGIDTEVAKVIGRAANNLDQVIEIDKGSTSSIAIGMPVVNQAGLIGRVTKVNRTTSLVMLITDSRYRVAVKVLAGEGDPSPTTVATTPSGLTDDELGDAATTTTSAPSVNPDTTLPGSSPFPGGTTTTTLPPDESAPTTTVAADDSGETAAVTTTTTTTTRRRSPVRRSRRSSARSRGGGEDSRHRCGSSRTTPRSPCSRSATWSRRPAARRAWRRPGSRSGASPTAPIAPARAVRCSTSTRMPT